MKKYLALILSTLGLFVFAVKADAKPNTCTTIKDGTILSSTGATVGMGYDMWGYNYQAHMFNGFYENYSRPEELATSGDKLMMKWNDAWLANQSCDGDNLLDRHFGHPTYNNSGAWLTNHMTGTYDGDWNVVGDWVLEFDYLGRLYIHDMTITDNTFTGTGGYPTGAPYTTTWTVTGVVDGDSVDMTINYDNSSYFVHAVGTIATDGTMSGTWSNNSQSGTWTSTDGIATRETCDWDYFVKIVTPSSLNGDYEDGGIWYNTDGVEIGPVIWTSFAIVQEVENDMCGGLSGVQLRSKLSPGLGYYKEYPEPVVE
jgi:hypothetical protein